MAALIPGKAVGDSNGHVQFPLQPAFRVQPSSDQDNLSNSNAGTTLAFGTEDFDQNGDFASNAFTAPVTGKYQLSFVIYIEDLDDAADYAYITLSTSNQAIYHIIDPKAQQDEDATYFTFTLSVLTDMDANDTAFLNYTQVGGAAQTDVTVNSHFSGFLAC